MTQILNVASRVGIVQVSDRLVSRPNGESFDPMSNKTLVIRARDAIAVMSYTGPAYIEDQPTDEYVAQVLNGEPFERYEGKVIAFGGSVGTVDGQDIGAMLQRIVERLNRELRFPNMSETRKSLLEFLVSGYHESDRLGLRPFVAYIRKPRESAVAKLDWVHREYRELAYSLDGVPDGFLSKSDIEALAARLRPDGKPEAVRAALVQEIRNVAARHPQFVSADCLAVTIAPIPEFHVDVRFFGQGHEMRIGRREPPIMVPAAFTPWLIGPGQFSGPCEFAGNATRHLAGIAIHLHGPPQTGAVRGVSAMSGQRRPHPPK